MILEEAYRILELDEFEPITFALLKRKFHKLALLYHPDKQPNKKEPSEHSFVEIQEAFTMLCHNFSFIAEENEDIDEILAEPVDVQDINVQDINVQDINVQDINVQYIIVKIISYINSNQLIPYITQLISTIDTPILVCIYKLLLKHHFPPIIIHIVRTAIHKDNDNS